jgi:hypothetical protein
LHDIWSFFSQGNALLLPFYIFYTSQHGHSSYSFENKATSAHFAAKGDSLGVFYFITQHLGKASKFCHSPANGHYSTTLKSLCFFFSRFQMNFSWEVASL